LGSKPTRELHARLFVIRLLTRLFYGCVVLESLTGVLQSIPDVGIAHLTPDAFRAAAARGRWATGSPEIAYAFARMSFTAFSDAIADSKFDETLRLASEGGLLERSAGREAIGPIVPCPQ